MNVHICVHSVSVCFAVVFAFVLALFGKLPFTAVGRVNFNIRKLEAAEAHKAGYC